MTHLITLLAIFLACSTATAQLPWQRAHRQTLERTAVAGSITPSDLNPVYWFKADAVTGKSEGDSVTYAQLTDQSANANNFQAGSGAGTIVYRATGGPNGVVVLQGQGTQPYFNRNQTSPALTQPFTICLVGRFHTNEANNIYFNVTNSATSTYFASSATDFVMSAGTPANTIAADTNYHKVILVYNGANSSYQYDGGDIVTVSVGTNNPDGLTLFNSWNHALNTKLWFCEVFSFAGDIGANRQAINNYFNTRYGL